MQLSDLLNFTRILLAEPSTTSTGRWSDADLTTLINQAQTQIALDLDWPESTYSGYTSASPLSQEYQLPELLKILRVYVAGQPIVPTTIPALGGDQIEVWDQSAANNQPQWVSQPPETYPYLSTTSGASGNGPNAGNTPWTVGDRPRFYVRGGNIGFVPIPSGAYYVQVDLIPQPPTLAISTDVSIYQTTFKDAICWKTVEYALFADSNSLLGTASTNYSNELAKLRSWKNDYQKMLPRGVFPITPRTFFQGPFRKYPTSGGRMGN